MGGPGKGLRAHTGCARGGGRAEGKARSAPYWLGLWTLIGWGAGRTGERSPGSPGVKAGVGRTPTMLARGTTGRLRGGAELRASRSDRALRSAVPGRGVKSEGFAGLRGGGEGGPLKSCAAPTGSCCCCSEVRRGPGSGLSRTVSTTWFTFQRADLETGAQRERGACPRSHSRFKTRSELGSGVLHCPWSPCPDRCGYKSFAEARP